MAAGDYGRAPTKRPAFGNPESGKMALELRGHSEGVTSADVSLDGSALYEQPV